MAASLDTKNDILNGAYSQLRISGITVIPSASDLELGLRRLENIMAELKEVWDVSIPYNFEDDPDSGSPHNLPRGLFDATEVYVATRLAADYGKQLPPSLAMRLKGAMASFFKYSAVIPQTPYPSRMPVGVKQAVFGEYFPETPIEPIGSEYVVLPNGSVTSLSTSFLTNMNDGETIDSYTIEVDDEITVDSDASDDYSVIYSITATGSSDDSESYPLMKITVVTTDSREIIKFVKFTLTSSEL